MDARILIVDDDPDIVANLVDILSDLGYATDTAVSGEDALHKLEANCISPANCVYDLCLLDLKMPGIDGVELYERFSQRNPSLRAILITAFVGEDGLQRAEDAGVWQVMRKPVDIPHLLEMVHEAVG